MKKLLPLCLAAFLLLAYGLNAQKKSAPKPDESSPRYGPDHEIYVLPNFDLQFPPDLFESMRELEIEMQELHYSLPNQFSTFGPELNEQMHELNVQLQEQSLEFSSLGEIIPELPLLANLPSLPDLPQLPDICSDNLNCTFSGRYSCGLPNEYKEQLSEKESVQFEALRSLMRRDEETAFAEAKRILQKSENWALRAAVVHLLGWFKNSEVVPIIRGVLESEKDQRVRLAAVRALSRRSEPEALEALRKLIE